MRGSFHGYLQCHIMAEACLVCSPVTTRESRRKQKYLTGIQLETANKLSRTKATLPIMLPSNIEFSEPLLCIDHDSRFTVSLNFGWLANAFINIAAVDTHITIRMDEQAQDTSGIRDAIKRLSSVISRTASTATTTLRRSKSRTFHTISNLPSKDAVPQRSAFRGSRSPGISDRRVSFYDSLPCLDYGPTFTVQLPCGADTTQRRGGLLLPAIATNECSADSHFREVEQNRDQSAMSPEDLQPGARHDSSVEPVSLRRSRSLRLSRTSASLSGNAGRRRSCMDFTKAMMQENARSQSKSRMRTRSFLADGTTSRANGQLFTYVPLEKEVHPRKLSLRTQNATLNADDLDDISHTYKAHVDRSLRSMQGHDKRGSAYLHESLVEMQEALEQAMAATTSTKPPSDEDEADHADAHHEVRQHISKADDSKASNDKTNDAFSFDMPYDSAQSSAEVINSAKATHLEAFPRLHASDAANQSNEDPIFDPALMPLPLRIRPRHARRDSTIVR